MQCPAQAAFDGIERSQAEGPQRASVGLSWARGKGSRAQALFGHEPSRAWARLVQSLGGLNQPQHHRFLPLTLQNMAMKTWVDGEGESTSHNEDRTPNPHMFGMNWREKFHRLLNKHAFF